MAANLEYGLTLQDKIRLAFNDYGSKHVPMTVDTLAGKLGEPPYNVYQALYRLKVLGEIDWEKEESSEGKRAKIVGFNIIKLEPSGRTYERAAQRSKNKLERITPEDYASHMGALSAYMRQKLAIYDMQDKAIAAGLNPETTVSFEPNPYAEEGLLLLNLVTEMSQKLAKITHEKNMLEYDLEAERRNVRALKGERQEATRRGLVAAAAN